METNNWNKNGETSEEQPESSSVKTALITGASSGIGFEIAKLFAKDGYNLVIVARHEDDLYHVANEFKKHGSNSVIILPMDLSIPGSARELYNKTKNHGIKIDVLVNDAGVGEHGSFLETDIEKELAIIQLNIVSLVELTKYYLKDMIARGSGRILQLASVASYQPTPLLSVYAATKAFVLSFSDALTNELKDINPDITMTALIPGPTQTDFFNKAGMEHTKAAQDADDPAIVAQKGYEALLAGEPHAYAPGMKRETFVSSVSSNETVSEKAHEMMEPADKEKKD